ncbi:MAG: HAMP domain-containing protein [Bdellovibrionales bacterium]|nr:HAMP domain-containing protein [Bdellovibrionales bacterium]
MEGMFSIRYKFLGVMTFLLLFCVGLYLFLATKIYIEDKTELIFDYNRNVVSNLTSDLDDLFQRVGDKMKLAAHFYQQKEGRTQKLIGDIIENSEELAFVGASANYKNLDQTFHLDKEFLQTYNLTEKDVLGESPSALIPFETIQKQGEAIWSVVLSGNVAPLLGYGKSVFQTDSRGQVIDQFAVVAYIRPEALYKEISQTALSEVIVTNQNGDLLFSESGRQNQVSHEVMTLFERSKDTPFSTHVLQFEYLGKKFLGAFSKGQGGRYIALSNIPYDKAFLAVEHLIYRSAILGSILFTLAVLGAILLSRSITRPIDTLIQGMGRVREGDLKTKIEIQTKDEVAVLAQSFNSMIYDLNSSREQLTEANRNLEDKVKARTQELAIQNQAVKEAQEALIRSTRLASIGEVAGQAAHEVLNPLTSIISRIQRLKNEVTGDVKDSLLFLTQMHQDWLQDWKQGGMPQLVAAWESASKVDPGKTLFEEDLENLRQVTEVHRHNQSELQKDLEFLLGESHRINRIVSSMRSLSVSHSEKREHSIHKLIDRSVVIMADLAEQQSIQFQVRLEAQNDTCRVDEDEFVQSMTNLIRNAIQAIEEAQGVSGKLTITTGSDEKRLYVDIEDNGVGMSEENQQKIFKNQFTTKSRDRGTGLGLGITRRFLRGFGGDIELLSSRRNIGTRFRLFLPLLQTNAKERSA